MRITVKNSRQKGFSLLVAAVVIMLLGACIQYGIGLFETETNADREKETVMKMKRLTAALSSYVQQHDRLPCPASPAVSPSTIGFGAEDIAAPGSTACTSGRFEGIVPFRTLNLDEYDARDGWGNLITYAAAPYLTDTQADANMVFSRCRTNFWYDSASNKNRNRYKARFCCPPAITYDLNTDLHITGESVYVRTTINMDDPDVLVSTAPTPAQSVESRALVLVSHGRNGHGAYLGNGTSNRVNLHNPTVPESQNANGDRVFVMPQRRLIPGPNYFDDIIVNLTQSQVYAYLSSGTCTIP